MHNGIIALVIIVLVVVIASLLYYIFYLQPAPDTTQEIKVTTPESAQTASSKIGSDLAEAQKDLKGLQDVLPG